MKKTILYFFVVLLVASAFGHLLKPEISDGFIPEFFPKQVIQILAFIVELTLGIGLLIPQLRILSAWTTFILMCLFLPVHFFDLLKDKPVIGNHTIATIRLFFQGVLIFGAWKMTRQKMNIR
jgi:uncharacterized membrane protein